MMRSFHSVYYNYYHRRFSKTKPLDATKLNGKKMLPSLKIYFYEFPYKLKMVGNNVHHDIKRHVEFSKWLNAQIWEFREQWTPTNFNLFLKDVDVVHKACEHFPDLIDEVHGPISEEHRDEIISGNITVEHREKLWHNAYDVKYIFSSSVELDNQANRKLKADLTHFINSNYTTCKWYQNSKTGNWYRNYLFTTEEEHNEIIPFLKMSYNDLLESVVRCKVINNVLEKK